MLGKILTKTNIADQKAKENKLKDLLAKNLWQNEKFFNPEAITEEGKNKLVVEAHKDFATQMLLINCSYDKVINR